MDTERSVTAFCLGLCCQGQLVLQLAGLISKAVRHSRGEALSGIVVHLNCQNPRGMMA